MHELVRQYAAERLAETPDVERQVRDRHAAHYAAALQVWGEALKGSGQLEALGQIEADLGNARLAWEWAVERGQVRELGRALDGLCRSYEWLGRYEEGDTACRTVADTLQAREDAEQPDVSRLWAYATAWRGAFNRDVRRLEQGKRLLSEALACLEDLASAGHEVRRERAFALWQMGMVRKELGDYDRARQCYEEGLAIYRALGDRPGCPVSIPGIPHPDKYIIRGKIYTR